MTKEVEYYVAENGEIPSRRNDVVSRPLDPWGAPYYFEVVGAEFRVISYGADNALGGQGIEMDIDLNTMPQSFVSKKLSYSEWLKGFFE